MLEILITPPRLKNLTRVIDIAANYQPFERHSLYDSPQSRRIRSSAQTLRRALLHALFVP